MKGILHNIDVFKAELAYITKVQEVFDLEEELVQAVRERDELFQDYISKKRLHLDTLINQLEVDKKLKKELDKEEK